MTFNYRPDQEEINHIGYGPNGFKETKCIFGPEPPKGIIESFHPGQEDLFYRE